MSVQLPPLREQIEVGFQMQFKPMDKLGYCTLLAVGILSGAALGTLLTASAWTFTLGAVVGASLASIAIIIHRKFIADQAHEKFQQAFNLTDEVQQFKQYKILADEGHRRAEYEVAMKLEYGIVGGNKESKPNLPEAFVYYKKSADHGLAKASFKVAIAYERGWGIQKNSKEALKYYEKSANQGLVKAHYELGTIYSEGALGLKVNGAKALHHYKQAANQGHVDAKKDLVKIYKKGLYGIEKNEAEAAKYK